MMLFILMMLSRPVMAEEAEDILNEPLASEQVDINVVYVPPPKEECQQPTDSSNL